MNIKYLFCFLLVLALVGGLFCLSRLEKKPTTLEQVQKALLQIPQHDQVEIERLFRYLSSEQGFAYTIFGTKPLSTGGCFTVTPVDALGDIHEFLLIKQRWKVWEKWQHKFPMKKFGLFCNHTKTMFTIHIVNKPAFLKKVKQHKALFSKILNSKIAPKQLFTSTIMSKDLVKETLHGSQMLYGILLGYGTQNATGFERLHSKKMYFLKAPKPCWNQSSSALSLPLPNFMVFDEDEALKLRTEYLDMREKIVKIISDKNFLEVTLAKLIE